LGTAGGGIAEMVLAAKLLDESVELVAGFHTLRALLVNLLAGSIWKLISRNPASELD
ncbi:MAG: AbrB family transcriptional regulator, partial [Halomonadaceae bacterium]|nr:AbrB family transcriptional regulator [Halomonadaceae bacterium]